LSADFVVYLGLLIRPRKLIAAENLFLRRQLAPYQERKVHPRRIDPATRFTLALLSRLFDWRDALIVVQPKTLIRWHRAGFRRLWHWKSKPGAPSLLNCGADHPYRFLVHDRDSIYAQALDTSIANLRLRAENTLPEPESKFAL
jgi:hypothetical protein